MIQNETTNKREHTAVHMINLEMIKHNKLHTEKRTSSSCVVVRYADQC